MGALHMRTILLARIEEQKEEISKEIEKLTEDFRIMGGDELHKKILKKAEELKDVKDLEKYIKEGK